jgi:hypothetical protein
MKKTIIAGFILASIGTTSLFAQTVNLTTTAGTVSTSSMMREHEGKEERDEIKDIWKNFKKGHKNDEVKNLQNFLIKQGKLEAKNNTGFFGEKTEKAFRKFLGGFNASSTSATSTPALDQATKDKIKAEMTVLASSTEATCVALAKDNESKVLAIIKKYLPNFVAPANIPADKYTKACDNIVRGFMPFGMIEKNIHDNR